MSGRGATVDGFLLTRHWRDTPQGIELLFWAWTPEGPVRILYPGQQAVCFVNRETRLEHPHLAQLRFERRKLELEDLNGDPVDGLYFRQQRDLNAFRETAAREHLLLCESEIKPADRFLMERFIMGPVTLAGRGVDQGSCRQFTAPRIKPGGTLPRFRYLSLDIETDGMDGAILSIAFCNAETEEILMQGDGEAWPTALPVRWCRDERGILELFMARMEEVDPDLLLGWNLVNFDLDYIERRCRVHGLPFNIGRGGETAAVLPPQQSGQPAVANIPGRVALDGIDHLRGAFWSFDSFELGNVAHQLLGRRKLIDDPDDKIAEIHRLFRRARPELAAYNLEDCRLVEAIFQKTDLIDFVTQRTLMTGLPLGRLGGSVAAFDNLYLPRLHRAGAVAFDVGAARHGAASPGGYVMDSKPGLYENVLVLDFKSLYPSIIRTFRIDPLGLARPGEDPVPGFLDARFSRGENSLLPAIIGELWEARDRAKRRRDAPLSQATKIIMNSFYGVLGSTGCRFHDPRLASSITLRGHEIIRRTRDWLEQEGFTVIYGDTDSVFVLLGPGVEEAEAQATGRRLAADLNGWWRETLARELRLVSHLEIEFETHFIRFLMPTIRGTDTGSKKRYAGYIHTGDGGHELIFKGLESVRSDWTPLAQEFQRELYRRVFFDEPFEAYIKEVVLQLRRGDLDHKLAYRKRLRRPLASYEKNVPPHVQAARKLDKPGRWIDYLITTSGPEPVKSTASPIDYEHYIDRQLAPAADGILHFLETRFEQIVADQMALF